MATSTIKCMSRTQVLFEGNVSAADEIISLNDDYTKYDFLLVSSMTKKEKWTDVVDVNWLSNQSSVLKCVIEHSSNAVEGGFQYNCYMTFRATSNTQLKIIDYVKNNVNWGISIRRIVGVKVS